MQWILDNFDSRFVIKRVLLKVTPSDTFLHFHHMVCLTYSAVIHHFFIFIKGFIHDNWSCPFYPLPESLSTSSDTSLGLTFLAIFIILLVMITLLTAGLQGTCLFTHVFGSGTFQGIISLLVSSFCLGLCSWFKTKFDPKLLKIKFWFLHFVCYPPQKIGQHCKKCNFI